MNLINHAADMCQHLRCKHKYWMCMEFLFNCKHFLCANSIRGSWSRESSEDVLKFIFQILSHKQLLLNIILPWYSFCREYLKLNTSGCKHKGYIHFSYLFCLKKLFRKQFHFCFFLKLWTQSEEYFLENTVFVSESSLPDSRTDGLCHHSPASGS